MKAVLKKTRNLLLDLVLPKFCIGCNKEGTYLCIKCKKEILLVSAQICPECRRLSDGGRYHPECRKDISLQGIIVSAYYKEGPTKELIHNFKYNSVTELKGCLGKMISKAGKDIQADLITFTPLHPRRLAQRGYNQAEILALEASRRLKIPCLDLLRKITHTKRQVGLRGTQRRKNLEGVFRIKNQELSIKNKKIVIVDDITTTGTTLNECAKVLKEAGAKEVWGLVISRG
jgi:ComF family protein